MSDATWADTYPDAASLPRGAGVRAGILSAPGVVYTYMQQAPVDLDEMALELGLRVTRTPRLPSGVSGKIYRCQSAPSGFCVDINAREAATRQRFTLAHEIAHYVLHRDLIGQDVTDDAMYRSSLGSHYESQANRLGTAIIMPARLVRAAHARTPELAQLAQHFHVSPEAMRIRLRELRLAPDPD